MSSINKFFCSSIKSSLSNLSNSFLPIRVLSISPTIAPPMIKKEASFWAILSIFLKAFSVNLPLDNAASCSAP